MNKFRAMHGIRIVLEHYQRQDDIAYNLLKGFAAKPGDGDPKSPARRAIALLDDIYRKETLIKP